MALVEINKCSLRGSLITIGPLSEFSTEKFLYSTFLGSFLSIITDKNGKKEYTNVGAWTLNTENELVGIVDADSIDNVQNDVESQQIELYSIDDLRKLAIYTGEMILTRAAVNEIQEYLECPFIDSRGDKQEAATFYKVSFSDGATYFTTEDGVTAINLLFV